ncbi:nuclear transport factor 2 family protein [Aminobacter sp. AP02]|uniref:nuclear transport factor 2 family protein n=1 Tax=Aminobacter sp. AP02 TaxID=2135737 RepID=UPI000D7B7F66|nr:nuclear transport factor 2 family protein [Aminobacter sp. AP02]PWK60347.1 putative lumazine-binding protein [Aminobacter sp. AP02]
MSIFENEGNNSRSLQVAVECYFDLLHTCDVTNFSQVFYETALLHGFRDGKVIIWTSSQYHEMLRHRPSPASLGAMRSGSILAIDFAADCQAVVKVGVTIGGNHFTDQLTYMKIDGAWFIVSKVFHTTALNK